MQVSEKGGFSRVECASRVHKIVVTPTAVTFHILTATESHAQFKKFLRGYRLVARLRDGTQYCFGCLDADRFRIGELLWSRCVAEIGYQYRMPTNPEQVSIIITIRHLPGYGMTPRDG